MTNKAMNTLKAIVESGMVPNEQGTPVDPSSRIDRPEYKPGDIIWMKGPVLSYEASKRLQHTSKQYTPSGAHEWDEPEKRYPLKFWILLAVACVSGATLGAVVPLEFVQGAF